MLKLRAINAYWDPNRPEIIQSLKQNPEDLSKEDLVELVKELDRRFIQLWDKIAFERDNKLGI